MATEKKREGKKHSNAKDLIKLVKTTTESLRTDSLVKEDLRKVPKRSAQNRKQSYLSLIHISEPTRLA